MQYILAFFLLKVLFCLHYYYEMTFIVSVNLIKQRIKENKEKKLRKILRKPQLNC